jgi:hypothetical protein
MSAYTATSIIGQQIAEQLAPILTPDLARLCDAIGAIAEPLMSVLQETGIDGEPGFVPAYGKLFDPVTCPGEYLPFLGNLIGVPVPVGASEAEARALIKAESGLERGTEASINAAIERSISRFWMPDTEYLKGQLVRHEGTPGSPLTYEVTAPFTSGATFTNLIRDPSFEDDPLGPLAEDAGSWGWTGTAGATHEVSAGWAAEGSRSVKITTPSDTGARDFFVYPFLAGVVPGETYTFRCVVNVLKLPASGAVYLELYFNEAPAGGKETEEGKHISNFVSNIVTTTGVHTLEVTAVAPALTAQGEPILELANGATAGVMELYADAFYFGTPSNAPLSLINIASQYELLSREKANGETNAYYFTILCHPQHLYPADNPAALEANINAVKPAGLIPEYVLTEEPLNTDPYIDQFTRLIENIEGEIATLTLADVT